MPSIKTLRQICQTSEVSPTWLSQSIEGRLNRIFSIYLTWVLIRFPFTPNQITVFGTLIYLAGASMFLFGELKFYLIGLGLILFSFILDACDGEVARYKRTKSRLRIGGFYVEPVSHDVQYALFFLPIGLGFYLKTGLVWPLVAAFIATSFKLLFRLLEFRFDGLARLWAKQECKEYGFTAVDKPKGSRLLYFIFRNLFATTGIFFPLLITSTLNRIDVFLYFYGISFFIIWLILFFKKAIKIDMKIEKEKRQIMTSESQK